MARAGHYIAKQACVVHTSNAQTQTMFKFSLQRPANLPLVQTHSRGSQNLLQLTPVHSPNTVGVSCCALLCSSNTAALARSPSQKVGPARGWDYT